MLGAAWGGAKEVKGCCLGETQAQAGNLGRNPVEGVRQRDSLQNQALEQVRKWGLSHHSGAWAAVTAKPESSLDLEDGSAAEIKGVFQG